MTCMYGSASSNRIAVAFVKGLSAVPVAEKVMKTPIAPGDGIGSVVWTPFRLFNAPRTYPASE